MKKKGILNEPLQAKIAKLVVGDYNEMLGKVAAAHPGAFVHVDLRGTLDPGDWANEMHPTRKGFEKVARKFLNGAKQAGALP
jgi:hypothetical protein